MALVYGVLGLVVILTAGTFGTINASPWFNLGIAVLFVVLGAGDVRRDRIDFSRFSERRRHRREAAARLPLAFTMGAVAALLAGACVAPVVIQVVLFASEPVRGGHDDRAGAAVRPRPRAWRFRGRSPAPGIAALPKPGAWMVRVKQAFGVLILVTAAVLRLPGVHAVRQPLGRAGERARRASRRS